MAADQLDRAQDLLAAFQAQSLHADALRADLVAREGHGGQTENLTLHTQSSDVLVDPDNLSRLEGDLHEFRTYFSQVKFSWMESNIKRRFVQRVLVDNPTPPPPSEVRAADEQCAEKKADLRHHKARAEHLQASIGDVARQLDQELAATTDVAEQVRTLSRSVRGLELDLAVLRNNQPPADQRMTLVEADAILARQTAEMASVEAAVTLARKQIAEKKAALAATKREVEQLEQERVAAERAAVEAERASQAGDAVLAGACRWYTATHVLLSRLIGIKSVSAVGSPPTELDVAYAVPDATLRLRFGPPSAEGQGALIAAQLLRPDVDIQDLVQPRLLRNDTVRLVQDVLARLSAGEMDA